MFNNWWIEYIGLKVMEFLSFSDLDLHLVTFKTTGKEYTNFLTNGSKPEYRFVSLMM